MKVPSLSDIEPERSTLFMMKVLVTESVWKLTNLNSSSPIVPNLLIVHASNIMSLKLSLFKLKIIVFPKEAP